MSGSGMCHCDCGETPGALCAPGEVALVNLLLRSQRFFNPAVKYLLVSFHPTINLTLNVGFG